MSLNQPMGEKEHRPGAWLTSRSGLVFAGFLAVTGFLLFTEHRAHVLGSLIYLLPLACIFMHLFHGHGGHHGHGRNTNDGHGAP